MPKERAENGKEMLPPFLKEGDMVSLVAPAGAIDEQYVDGAIRTLQSWGLRVKESEHVRGRNGRYSGTEEERLKDLQQSMDDPETKAVLCVRGGYGLMKIVDGLNVENFEIRPKWIIGYSDVTVMHNLCGAISIGSLHGIMAKHLSTLPADAEAVRMLRDILFGKLPEYRIPSHPLNRRGEVKGRLTGGNLTLLSSLRSTPYDLNIYDGNSILFIEDVAEASYRIDRMIENLRLSGVLENLSGLIVGQFADCEEDDGMGCSIYEGIAKAVEEYDYPVCFGFPAGHVENNLPLIMHANTELIVGEEEKGVKLNFNCKQ